MSLHQDHDKAFRTFATRLRRKAETCNFTTISECGEKNVKSYTEEAVKDVLQAGVGDEDTRRKVLSTEDILSRSSFEKIFFIESKEMGRHATEGSRNDQQYLCFNDRKSNLLM